MPQLGQLGAISKDISRCLTLLLPIFSLLAQTGLSIEEALLSLMERWSDGASQPILPRLVSNGPALRKDVLGLLRPRKSPLLLSPVLYPSVSKLRPLLTRRSPYLRRVTQRDRV